MGIAFGSWRTTAIFIGVFAIALIIITTGLVGPGSSGCDNEDLKLVKPFGQSESSMTTIGLQISYTSGDIVRGNNTEYISIILLDSNTDRKTSWNWSTYGKFPIKPGDSITIPKEKLPPYISNEDTVQVIWYGYNAALPDHCDRELLNSKFANSTISNSKSQ